MPLKAYLNEVNKHKYVTKRSPTDTVMENNYTPLSNVQQFIRINALLLPVYVGAAFGAFISRDAPLIPISSLLWGLFSAPASVALWYYQDASLIRCIQQCPCSSPSQVRMSYLPFTRTENEYPLAPPPPAPHGLRY